ncbi:MAG: sodium:solute symporter family protein, partial [Planctomycetes bacterium]|nr:sodium:solute symporter family protein [Planctomycetota bacterium]
FSTFTLMGMPDFFRVHGIGAWIFLAIPDAAMFFLVIWFGFYLRRAAAKHNYQSMGGLLSRCYESKWAGISYFVGIFIFLIPYVAVQIHGIAVFLDAASGETLPPWVWSIGIVCVMLLYSEVGGLKAIIHCDAIQGTILLIVIWIVALGCLRSVGGVTSMFSQVQQADPALLSTPGPEKLFTPQFLIASFFAITLIPVTQPQVTTRLIIIRNQRTMFHMATGLGIFTLLVLVPTIIIGLYGSIKYPSPEVNQDTFVAQVLLHEQPSFIAAMVLVGLLAAATSTADSQIFAMGSELRGLLLLKGKSPLIYTRVAIFSFGAAALVFSLVSSKELVPLALKSFAGTSLMAPMIFAAVFSKRKPGFEIIIVTFIAMAAFLVSQLFEESNLVPKRVYGWNIELLLLLVLGVCAAISGAVRQSTSERALSS